MVGRDTIKDAAGDWTGVGVDFSAAADDDDEEDVCVVDGGSAGIADGVGGVGADGTVSLAKGTGSSERSVDILASGSI